MPTCYCHYSYYSFLLRSGLIKVLFRKLFHFVQRVWQNYCIYIYNPYRIRIWTMMDDRERDVVCWYALHASWFFVQACVSRREFMYFNVFPYSSPRRQVVVLNQQAERSILRNQPVPGSITHMRTNLEVEQSGTIFPSYFPVDLPSQYSWPCFFQVAKSVEGGTGAKDRDAVGFTGLGTGLGVQQPLSTGDVPRATGAGTRSAWHRDPCGQGVPWRQLLELSHVEPLFWVFFGCGNQWL